jgi:GNAT superfamily N-acetyltransferase
MVVTAESILVNLVYVVEDSSGILGYYELLPTATTSKGYLESLFVLPRAIGMGCGKQLWQHLIQTAAEHGYTCFEFEADPNAEGFYQHMGAYRIGERASGIVAGRLLPLMRYDLSHDTPQ